MAEALDEVRSDLTLIKISIATQAADLGYIKEKVAKIDAVEERLRTVESDTAKIVKIDDIEKRVHQVELDQAADRSRRNWQDGFSAFLAVIAGLVGISK